MYDIPELATLSFTLYITSASIRRKVCKDGVVEENDSTGPTALGRHVSNTVSWHFYTFLWRSDRRS